MADIDAYKDKFSETGQRVLETALAESRKRDQNYVSIEHILHAIAFEEEERTRAKYELPPFLRHFGVSMNKLARQDKIPPTIGREQEIMQMIEILSHRERSNSPMLVGEPGVGKTAVVEGLARLIELEPEKVPARLRDSHIVRLQMGGLVAGSALP